MSQEKLKRLTTYAEGLENRLKGTVPPRHKHRPTEFKQMVESDLRKTKLAIEKLTK